MSKRVRALLEDADPARGVAVGSGDADAVLRRAATDITSYEAAPPRRAPRRAALVAALAAAATAVVVVAVALALPGRRPAPGPVPGPPVVSGSPSAAPGCLAALADRLAPAPYDGRAGRYEYVYTRRMGGASTEMPGGGFATMTRQVEARVWTAADGSGRWITDRGPVQYADDASRAFYTAHPQHLDDAHEEETFAPGGQPPRPLPAADPAAMAEQLYRPRENGPSVALVGVADLYAARILDRAHRAAVLRFLATTEGVTCAGETPTEAGSGLLVTAPVGRGPHPSPGGGNLEALLFDPRTGELLAAGPDPRRWGVVYVERGYTDQTG
jgi:hypothetical protein